MPKFDELQAQFRVWDAALTEYERQALLVMLGFYNGFRGYLGVDAISDKLVKMCKISPAGTGLTRYVEVDHFAKALAQDDDGSWRFGLTVTLGEEGLSIENKDTGTFTVSIPRSATFYFDLRFTLHNGECVFTNAADNTKSFSCRFTDNGSVSSVIGLDELCEYLARLIEGVLRLTPGEMPGKASIGFDLSRRA